jgi:DNA (cytosine-5)-methyltransferase 1
VVYAIDRESFNCGQNYARNLGITEDGINSTLKAQGPSAVATPIYSSSKASFFTDAKEELANTLVATDYKDPPLINDNDGIDYTVRRLTPTECARLQGFPDWWCSDLGIETPTMDDLRIWYDIFETFRKATGAYTKPKTLKQITKWLKNPHSDSAEYKMWGNGVALPNVCFVLSGIVWFTQLEVKY